MEVVEESAPGSTPKARDRRRVPILDGVRAVCALAVVLAHVGWTARLVGSYADPPSNTLAGTLVIGLEGLLLGPFFVLSGMFLYRPFARTALAGTPRPALGRFYLRRAARLLPAYWLVTAVCLLLLNFSSIDGAWYVLRPIVLMQAYDFHWMAGMDPLWTVPTEAQFYLVLPLIAWVMHRLARGVSDPVRKARRMLIPPVILMLAGFAWTIYIHRASMGPFPRQYWWPFWGTGLFALGMTFTVLSIRAQVTPDRPPLLYRAIARRPNLFWLGALAAYAVNCAAPWGRRAYGDWQTVPAGLSQYVLSLVFAFLLLAPLQVPDASSRFMDGVLGNPVMRYLGRISYGIYLWHFVVINVWMHSGSVFGHVIMPQQLRGTIGFWELMAATTLGSVAVASVSYFLFERPILNRVRGSTATVATRVAPVGVRGPAPAEPEERERLAS